ncbi:DUF6059 family protein [Streptomyces sp. NL15-2K]|jgi:hypothetical protein|uniref:DUF6059 family protein n=1 Tax=Streptomyces sp. NL15-2K TaxID=376149 RepID=UPI000F5863AC|nr:MULTISPECIES: DUF6059 family protein [Actinomycetes]WKX06012.1 hypothetical protein Q4V64_00280 [Kutzneria buriramensis]GCB53268.1 hypothetical protein SNL152K_10625 [Streptomyces sp. NL15-2K]
MLRPLKAIAYGCVRLVWESLVAYGKVSCCVADLPESTPTAADPGPRHPERVRRDVPLSRVEKTLQRQLRNYV